MNSLSPWQQVGVLLLISLIAGNVDLLIKVVRWGMGIFACPNCHDEGLPSNEVPCWKCGSHTVHRSLRHYFVPDLGGENRCAFITEGETWTGSDPHRCRRPLAEHPPTPSPRDRPPPVPPPWDSDPGTSAA